MTYLDTYVTVVFGVKLFFLVLLLVNIYLKKTKKNQALQNKISTLKDHTETIFVVMMSLLLMYLFNPFVERASVLDYETKLLLFIFGFISIVLLVQN
jgi:uncharacterized membrane protein YbjE (DUF340 family)